MSNLSTWQLLVFAFTPMVLTIALVASIAWFRAKRGGRVDGAERLLSAAVGRMPAERNEWGEAMMAELIALEGRSFRWWFALGCARAALFPPATTSWPRYWFDAVRRLGPVCGVLSVVLPPLGLPLLYLASIACNAFMTHDNFSSGELVPSVLGAVIMLSLACILAGVPLGIAGLVRREQFRWLSLIGPPLSISIFCYLQIVQVIAAGPSGA